MFELMIMLEFLHVLVPMSANCFSSFVTVEDVVHRTLFTTDGKEATTTFRSTLCQSLF